MDSVNESLIITVSIVTLFLIPGAILSTIYFIKRNRFYINVNCWFCNDWTKVPYSERNSFFCPYCQQYNGFNEDGGYNKVIKAQFDTSSSKRHIKATEETEPSSNGLCTYCNNNQQLKIRQLANFVPLNEKNYDVEVEHFRLQLEKSYKLCKKCDKVLKTTVEKQHAWLFGNRIKALQKKSINLVNQSKVFSEVSKKYLTLEIIRYFLIVCSFVILYQVLNEHISISTVKEYLPEIFVPYTVVLSHWHNSALNAVENVSKSINTKVNFTLLSGIMKADISRSDLLPITWIGLILEIILMIWQQKSLIWKVNELIGWIILMAISSHLFHDDYGTYINALQIFCSLIIISGLLMNKSGDRKLQGTKKFTFKKLKVNGDKGEDSDEETSEEALNSSFYSTNSHSEKSYKTCYTNNTSHCQLHSNNFLYRDVQQNAINDAFTTARSTKCSSALNTSLKNDGNELHRSLDNLHLSTLSVKPPCTSPVFSANSVRPILTPPKLKSFTQNSWTAGGFWKNDVAAFPTSPDIANSSRSSSQSSGFMSANDPVAPTAYNSLPSSREQSIYGDFERVSVFSEPAYHFKPINSNNSFIEPKNNFSLNTPQITKRSLPKTSQLYYKTDNNVFYPVIEQNSMLVIQGSQFPCNKFESSFSNMSLRSFSACNNRFKAPVFGEKPRISSLFKNLQGVGTQSHTFSSPHC